MRDIFEQKGRGKEGTREKGKEGGRRREERKEQ